MSTFMNDIERWLWREVKLAANNPGIRKKDILEWTSGKAKRLEGETVFKINFMDMDWEVVIPSNLDKSGKKNQFGAA